MKFQVFKGNDIRPYINTVANFRIKIFREYPYLYDGNFEYEEKYLQGYASNPNSLLILVTENNETIGVATSLPLESDSDILSDVEKLFLAQAYKPEDFYYLSEIMIKPGCRHRGIAKKIYQIRVNKALENGFKYLCFAAIIKSKDDPNKPESYFNPAPMWKAMGFVPHDSITIEYNWPTIQSNGNSIDKPHKLKFWIKPL
jgi:predicted GNAT superfamily acetyltransferase